MSENEMTLTEALNSLMGEPGIEVANSPIDIDSLVEAIHRTKENENNMSYFNGAELNDFLSKNNIDEALEMFRNSYKGEPTIHSTSNRLVQFLNESFNPEGNVVIANVIEGIVTIGVIRSLEESNYDKIVLNAIHVADSNYEKTVDLWPRNAHLCFYFNPVTYNYGLSMITEGSNSFFYPLTRSLKNVNAIVHDLRAG